MKILKDEQKKLFDSKCQEVQGHRYELSWKYSGNVKGFVLCASRLEAESMRWEVLEENPDLKEAIRCEKNQRIPLDGQKDHLLYYYTQSAYRKGSGIIKLLEEVTAPRKISILWVDEEDNLHMGGPDQTVSLPVTVRCQMNRERRKVSFLHKEWFCDLSFNAVNIREIPCGAVCYRIGSLKYPLDIARYPVTTLKLEDENTQISVEVMPEYRNLYKIERGE
jgi:hypothetical protein